MGVAPKVGDFLDHPEYGAGRINAVSHRQIEVGNYRGVERTTVYVGDSLQRFVCIRPGWFQIMTPQAQELHVEAARLRAVQLETERRGAATLAAQERKLRDEAREIAAVQLREKQRIEEMQQRLKRRVITHLEADELQEADVLYKSTCVDWWQESEYLAERANILFAREFVEIFHRSSLSELDGLFISRLSEYLTADEFVELKRQKVTQMLSAIEQKLDPEQAAACARPETRVLVRARAGSGKTRTLCARAKLAILDEKLDPDRVLILAFNRSAASEVERRMQKEFACPTFRNARTFHSLAHQLAKPKRELLFDVGREPSHSAQSVFVQTLLNRILNPAFKQSLYQFFRKEMQEIEQIGRNLSPLEYRAFRRSIKNVSLAGELVKSKGEKYIADFLFEIGITYKYENVWDWKEKERGLPYRPDFSLFANGADFIIEHWALDPLDSAATLPEEWDITADQYRRQIIQKREVWKSKNIELLETNSQECNGSREEFESVLKSRLEAAGIKCQRRPENELVEKVFENDFHVSRMAKQFLQFIQRAKKGCLSVFELGELISKSSEKDERQQLFYKLALRTFAAYQEDLETNNKMDFDDLLLQAIQQVEQNGKGASIYLGDNAHISIGQLKWILVDEYQDFSELYYRLLRAILLANPEIRLMAVGDDWQAINGFAGAEIRFFDCFDVYFPGAGKATIATNYRSTKTIVNCGNRLMTGLGDIARAASNVETGDVCVLDIKPMRIEFRNNAEFNDMRQRDAIYLPNLADGKYPTDAQLRVAKVLKIAAALHQQTPSGKVLLLSRTKRVYGIELEELKRRLVEVLVRVTGKPAVTLKKQIRVLSTHTSKGQEEDSVLVLDANQRNFPTVHPDNFLYEIFGVTPMTILSEERRPFYVAITRASKTLWILTEGEDVSPYVLDIQAGSALSSETEEVDDFTKTGLVFSQAFLRIRAELDKATVSNH